MPPGEKAVTGDRRPKDVVVVVVAVDGVMDAVDMYEFDREVLESDEPWGFVVRRGTGDPRELMSRRRTKSVWALMPCIMWSSAGLGALRFCPPAE
jgi:hypothetical protein